MNKIRKVHKQVLDYYQNNFPVLKYRFSQESLKWKLLKNKYLGKRCFILGNGPSLKQQDLTLLKDEITFVSNWFVFHEKYEEINPNYYCICAHEIFGTPTDAYVRWDKNVNFDAKLYNLLQQKAKKTVKVFPFFFKKSIKKQKLFDRESLRYLLFEPPVRAIHKIGYMNLDIANQRMDSAETIVINFCLPIAYYLGFKEIYLLGCDCDYEIKKADDPRSYFYNSQQQSSDAPSFEWLQRSWASDGPMIQSYAVARKEFEQQGRTIYNATDGGKLEVFPRVKYKDIISNS